MDAFLEYNNVVQEDMGFLVVFNIFQKGSFVKLFIRFA